MNLSSWPAGAGSGQFRLRVELEIEGFWAPGRPEPDRVGCPSDPTGNFEQHKESQGLVKD